jgi:UDP-2,3-diacylglucosamine hydrolase
MPPALSILPDPPPPPTPVGLIAGGGRLPILVAQSLRERGHKVVGLGLSGQYDKDLPGLCDRFREAGVLRIASWGRILAQQGVRHAIMVGLVDKAKLMHDPLKMLRNIPDARTVMTWYGKLRHDRRSSVLLAAIADELDRHGVGLMDSTAPIQNHLASAGVMTQRSPTEQQRADVAFVWPLLAEMLKLDIGQAVAVRDRDVIAVEAVEGTDRMIQRVGQLCRAKGWTLCKGARAGHDRRSDVPTVGPKTIENLAAHGGGCLALAAGDVIMVDRDAMLNLADQLGIAVIGLPTAQPASGAATVAPMVVPHPTMDRLHASAV